MIALNMLKFLSSLALGIYLNYKNYIVRCCELSNSLTPGLSQNWNPVIIFMSACWSTSCVFLLLEMNNLGNNNKKMVKVSTILQIAITWLSLLIVLHHIIIVIIIIIIIKSLFHNCYMIIITNTYYVNIRFIYLQCGRLNK